MKIGSANIEHQNTVKILGLTLSEDLRYDDHLYKGKQNMTKSLNAKCSILRLLKPYIPLKQLALIGGNLMNSTILYAAPVWATTTQSNMQKIQSSQIKAARMVTGYKKRGTNREHRQTTLNQINWPNTTQIVTSATLNLIERATMGASSNGINNMFTSRDSKHTRQCKAHTIQHIGPLNRPKTNFTTYGTELFNNLPHTLRDKSLSCEKFKNELKSYSKAVNLLQMH